MAIVNRVDENIIILHMLRTYRYKVVFNGWEGGGGQLPTGGSF